MNREGKISQTADGNFCLDGKIALITGAAGGIGYAIAQIFAKKKQ